VVGPSQLLKRSLDASNVALVCHHTSLPHRFIGTTAWRHERVLPAGGFRTILAKVTFDRGYALTPGDVLEDLDMGGGSLLSLKVTGQQSLGLVTVLEGVVHSGGPPLHVHEAEDEVVIVLEGQLDYQVGEERGALPASGLLWFPRKVPHAVANLTGKPCRFITVVTSSGIEDFFRRQRDYLADLPPGIPPDPVSLAAVPGAEQRRVVGPTLTPQA
jgi:quercetin dioxygenase-like cupin family protein